MQWHTSAHAPGASRAATCKLPHPRRTHSTCASCDPPTATPARSTAHACRCKRTKVAKHGMPRVHLGLPRLLKRSCSPRTERPSRGQRDLPHTHAPQCCHEVPACVISSHTKSESSVHVSSEIVRAVSPSTVTAPSKSKRSFAVTKSRMYGLHAHRCSRARRADWARARLFFAGMASKMQSRRSSGNKTRGPRRPERTARRTIT